MVNKAIIKVCSDVLEAKLAALKTCSDFNSMKAIMLHAPMDEDLFEKITRITDKRIEIVEYNGTPCIRVTFKDSSDINPDIEREYYIIHACNMNFVYNDRTCNVVYHWFVPTSIEEQVTSGTIDKVFFSLYLDSDKFVKKYFIDTDEGCE